MRAVWILLLVGITAAIAMKPEEGFKQADANSNSKVDLKEVKDFYDEQVGIQNVNTDALENAFGQADANTDDEVSLKEFKAWNKKYGKK